MPRALGYGGLANTNGVRSFVGKEEAGPVVGFMDGKLRLSLDIGIGILLTWLGIGIGI